MPRGALSQTFNIMPFPTTYKCKLKYVESVVLYTGTAGIMGTEQVFRLNSLYDPNFTGTGHQPYGYDQLNGIYKKYMVSGVHIRVTFSAPSLANTACGAMIQASQDTVALTGASPDGICERPNAWCRVLNPTGEQVTTFEQYVQLSALEGLSDQQYLAEPDNYGSDVSNNPSLIPYLRVAAGSFAASAGQAVVAITELTFDCRFFERITQAQS